MPKLSDFLKNHRVHRGDFLKEKTFIVDYLSVFSLVSAN